MSIGLGFLGLALGLDSFVVGTGLGATLPDWRRRLRLAFAFALCDGLASYLGSIIGASWRSSLEWGEWLGPAAVGIYGIYVLGLAWYNRQLATTDVGVWLALGLPLCLSFDNLAMGVGPDASPGWAVLSAFAFGAASGCLALVGLRLGGALTRRVRLRAEWLGGGLLVAVAIILLCKEMLS